MGTRADDARKHAIAALGLLVPVPALGALCAFVWAPGPLGQAVYFAAKAWLLVLPLCWRLWIEREPLSLSPLAPGRARSALLAGGVLGALLAGAILGAYAWLGKDWIDASRLREAVRTAGLTSRGVYLGFSAYLILVNSLLEEFVWRWFCYRQCEVLMGRRAAVVVAALCFTLHHAIVFAVQFEPRTAALAACGVFAGGCVWSACYARFRSIWPGYVSHVGADVAGLWIGWHLLF